jgi:hypothetical protein
LPITNYQPIKLGMAGLLGGGGGKDGQSGGLVGGYAFISNAIKPYNSPSQPPKYSR